MIYINEALREAFKSGSHKRYIAEYWQMINICFIRTFAPLFKIFQFSVLLIISIFRPHSNGSYAVLEAKQDERENQFIEPERPKICSSCRPVCKQARKARKQNITNRNDKVHIINHRPSMERAKAFINKRTFLYRDWNKVSSDSWLDLVQAISKSRRNKAGQELLEISRTHKERKKWWTVKPLYMSNDRA